MLEIRRREFVVALGGAAAWPLAARGQDVAVPVVGFLSTRAQDESAHLSAAFRRGLAETGYSEGRNVAIQYRWADGRYDRLPALAAELARRPVTVLAAVGGQPAASAAKAATATIPIVAAFSTDPVAAGLVESLSRPAGNVTGVSNLSTAMEPKRLSLLRELVRPAARMGVLLNPTFPPASDQLSEIDAAARSIGQPLEVLRASTDDELAAAFATIAQQRIRALLVASDPFFNSRRARLAELAASAAVPAMYGFRDYVVAGGLMSYGIDLADVYRQVGLYAGRILKGAKLAELPVLQPIKFEFVLNLKTAKTLGIKFPDDLLSLADEVIE
ncbi:MAG TPA: ABC transporter substrate-binding protein [Xanthobacteraceae bacterium]|jgi:putative ABC transport system substrate-binding protein